MDKLEIGGSDSAKANALTIAEHGHKIEQIMSTGSPAMVKIVDGIEQRLRMVERKLDMLELKVK
jgi:hypothetical protein